MLAFFLLIDPTYMLFVMLPCAALAGLAHLWVKSAYARASKIVPRSRCTGAQAAQRILQQNGIQDVDVEPVQGFLSDHYDPRHKVLRLSTDVYQGRSLAAVGIAAHEAGHAIQDARAYAPLAIRNAIVPMASIGSRISMGLLLVGMLLGGFHSFGFSRLLVLVGIAFFAVIVLSQLVNLPVEFNASTRARQVLLASGVVAQDEDRIVAGVLRAAAMTYVAATITAIAQLLYWMWRAGLLGGRRD